MKQTHTRARRALAMLAALALLSSLPACGFGEGSSTIYPDVTVQSDLQYTALTDEQKAQIPLINPWHELPGGFSLPSVTGRAEGDYSVVNGFSPLVNLYEQRHSFRLAASDIWLCRHVYDAAQALFAAAESEDMNGFIITSGYRSHERQQEIYNETEQGYAALPGQSEHETGLCFDVTAMRDDGTDFSTTPQYQWLINHCWQYGFILRYPDGTSETTGILGESWHFRYVGVDAAQEILERGITLEEYLDGITPDPISAPADISAYAGGAASGAPVITADPAATAAAPTMQPASAPATPTLEPTAQPTAAPTPEPTAELTPVPTVQAAVPSYQPYTFELEGKQMEFIDPTYEQKDGVDVIYLAGGCFWGMEKLMQSLNGVLSATNGYANGNVAAPSYQRVCQGDTGSRETVRVEYDPAQISLDDLLYAYFEVVDPELINRQGHDTGTQYQAGIYYITDASRQTVEAVAEQKRAQYANFAVEIAPLSCFYDAEEYHQDYLDKNPGGYCHIPFADIARIADELNG